MEKKIKQIKKKKKLKKIKRKKTIKKKKRKINNNLDNLLAVVTLVMIILAL